MLQWAGLTALVFAFAGCAGMGSTVFVHQNYNFNFVEKVAVVPFENLSNDQGASARVSHLFITELLATDAFDVVEPGEVLNAISKLSLTRTDMLSEDQAKQLGKALDVQAVILGSVNESSAAQAANRQIVVTLDVRMVETESAQTVWSATHTEGSKSFLSSLFGTGQKSQSEVARQCVRKVIKTLVR
jgi:TolB-like protein